MSLICEYQLFSLNIRLKHVDMSLEFHLQGFELATVLAWTDHELYKGGKALDWKTNSNYMSNILSLPKTTKILTAAFGSHPASFGALVMYTDSVQLSLLTCYETEGIWKTRTLLSTNVLQGPFQMLFVSAALELCWCGTKTQCFLVFTIIVNGITCE